MIENSSSRKIGKEWMIYGTKGEWEDDTLLIYQAKDGVSELMGGERGE